MLAALLLAHIACGLTVVLGGLAELDALRAADHFVQGADATQAHFVSRAAEHGMHLYSEHMNRFFLDGKNERNMDLDALLEEQGAPLTNIHVAEAVRDDYTWDYAQPDAIKNGRRLEDDFEPEEESFGGDDHRELGSKKRRPYFTLKDRPPGVPLSFIKPLEKPDGGSFDHIALIFKCKNDCKTIFTREIIKEMHRFSAELAAHPRWY